MAKDTISTRRMFLQRGALLAAPIGAAAVPAAAIAESGTKSRIGHLEDEAAIRASHRAWLRRVNAAEGDALLDGTVRRITVDHAGVPERIEIAADGRTAVGRFDYAVDVETPLAADCTLGQMAQAQGYGTVRRTERRILTAHYAKRGGAWEIEKVALSGSRAL
jgi:hypothetical protein